MTSSSYISEVDFLPARSILLAPVTLSEDVSPVIQGKVETWTKRHEFVGRKPAVPIILEEPLKMRFSISKSWNIQQDLVSCKCSIPFENEKQLESVNSAYQRVSEVVETHRRSRGGSVYLSIYYRDPARGWRLLKERRDEVFEPHRAKYEELIRRYKDSTPPLVRSQEPFANLVVGDQERLAQILHANKKDVIPLLQELEDFYEKTNLQLYRRKIEEFESNLHPSRRGALNEAYWQDWIYKNSWMLGSQYGAPLPKERVGFGSIPDFLFPTLDGFVDVLEIKTPDASVLVEDSSHDSAFRWSRAASEAISQVTTYLDEVDANRATLTQRIEDKYSVEILTLRPRGLVLMGCSDAWKRREKESFRKLSHTLHGIEIVTYTNLLQRAKGLVALFQEIQTRRA